ncbi:hypothetical protein ACTFIV_003660 [Dictyostelium citrinum]
MNSLIRRSIVSIRTSTVIKPSSFGLMRNNRFYSTENNQEAAKPEETENKPAPGSLEETIEKLKEELEETKKQLLYTAADRENVRRFAKEDNEKAKKFGIQSFTKELLEVVDQLEMATNLFPKEKLDANKELKDLHEGVKMTEQLFLKIMGNQGLQRFNPIGEKFDFNSHHAIYEMNDPTKENNTVGHVVKQGYKLHDRLVRPAMVGVNKIKPQQ